jgi:hypothetical protein
LAITERSQVIREAVDNGNLLVVGAVYDVTSGVIEFRGIPKQHSAG